MASSNKWAEYRAGTLVPPAVVQKDDLGSTFNVWVYTTTQGILGPFPRDSFGAAAEAKLLAFAETINTPDNQITTEDGTVIIV